VTVLYTRPSGYEDVPVDWQPDDEQAGAEALASIVDGVPDASTALDQAPHDLDQATAEAVREEYVAILEASN